MTIFAYRPLKRKNKERYIFKHYKKFKAKYEKYIECGCMMQGFNYDALFFSIMIFENYNRPILLRGLEYIIFCVRYIIGKKRTMSLGIMQVKCNHLISSIGSVKLANVKIRNDASTILAAKTFKCEEQLVKSIALEYNRSTLYADSILDIYNSILCYDSKLKEE